MNESGDQCVRTTDSSHAEIFDKKVATLLRQLRQYFSQGWLLNLLEYIQMSSLNAKKSRSRSDHRSWFLLTRVKRPSNHPADDVTAITPLLSAFSANFLLFPFMPLRQHHWVCVPLDSMIPCFLLPCFWVPSWDDECEETPDTPVLYKPIKKLFHH